MVNDDNNDDDNDDDNDGRRSMGILQAHLRAFGSGELKRQHICVTKCILFIINYK